MKCPYCGTLDNRVIDSRLSQAGEVTRRRRECDACERRYTTYERVERVLPLVLKRDGRRHPFDRMKLMAGLRRAVVKRPVDDDTLERMVIDVERELAGSGEKEVHSTEIGRRVLRALKDVDAVAYVRFASVYRNFENVDEFVAELENVPSDSAEGKAQSE